MYEKHLYQYSLGHRLRVLPKEEREGSAAERGEGREEKGEIQQFYMVARYYAFSRREESGMSALL